MEFFNYLDSNLDYMKGDNYRYFNNLMESLKDKEKILVNNYMTNILAFKLLLKSKDITFDEDSFMMDLKFLGIDGEFILRKCFSYFSFDRKTNLDIIFYKKVKDYLLDNVNFKINDFSLAYELCFNFITKNKINFGYSFIYYLFKCEIFKDYLYNSYESNFNDIINLKLPLLVPKDNNLNSIYGSKIIKNLFITIGNINTNNREIKMYYDGIEKDENFFLTEEFEVLLKSLYIFIKELTKLERR